MGYLHTVFIHLPCPQIDPNLVKTAEQEGRALLAAQAIQTKQVSSVRDTARQYNVRLLVLHYNVVLPVSLIVLPPGQITIN